MIMINVTNKAKCCGCEACANVCPKACISITADKDGFRYPEVNKDLCINCSLCEKVCPILNNIKSKNKNVEFYACSSKQEDSKKNSSSGGIFYLLAVDVINRGGVVYATKMDGDCKGASFDSATSVGDLNKLLGSKYVHSKLGKQYKNVLNNLKTERPVLFCGTPCQVNGLKRYLGKEYDNLYLLDLVCHGVPSDKVWKEYLSSCEDKAGGNVSRVIFRDKETGWKKYSMSVIFDNGKKLSEDFRKDAYGKAFNSRIIFRPSCEHCRFKGVERVSDITLGDFWGIGEIEPDFDDDTGTTLLMIHSEKGKKLFNNISENIVSKKVDKESAIRRNPYVTRSVIPHRNKKKFFDNLGKMDFDTLVLTYAIKEFLLRDFTYKLKKYIIRKIKKGHENKQKGSVC